MSTNIGNLPPPVQQSFDMKLLSRPMPKLIHKLFAMPKVLEDNSGQILRMRRYTNLATAPVPLGDAMLNPPPQQLTAIDIDARVQWYGKVCAVVKPSVIDLEAAA